MALLSVFAQADTNSDGLLSFAESQAALNGLTRGEFDRLDSNSDEMISRAELEALTGPNDDGCMLGKGYQQSVQENLSKLLLLGVTLVGLVTWGRMHERS